MQTFKNSGGLPPRQGLYDPANEHDACGVGFIVNMRGEKSHAIVRSGLEILVNLTHRGACGCDPLTGDGAGILTQMPHEFFRAAAAEFGFDLPPAGDYGVGSVFLPRTGRSGNTARSGSKRSSPKKARRCSAGATCRSTTQCWAAPRATSSRVIRQVFIARGPDAGPHSGFTTSLTSLFEWKLYVIRKRLEIEIRNSRLEQKQYFNVPEPVVAGHDLQGIAARRTSRAAFYRDLADERFISALGPGASALQHQHVSHLGPGPSVSLIWPTTAKSTRSAATSTGCTPGKACSLIRISGPT